MKSRHYGAVESRLLAHDYEDDPDEAVLYLNDVFRVVFLGCHDRGCGDRVGFYSSL